MVVSDYSGRGARASARRGVAIAADNRRGIAAEDYGTWHVPFIERVSANQFERWLVQKFGPEYLQPVHLFKDGGGI